MGGDALRLPASMTDGVVLLDAHTISDAEAHLRGEDAEMLLRFDSPARATLEQTRAAIGRWIDARAAGGPMFAYALRRPSGLLVGGCEVRRSSPKSANVSYWVFPEFRNQGYATRALTLLCESARRLRYVRQLEAHVDPDNIASRRVAEKAGFVEAGFVEDTSWAGTRSTRVLYVWRVDAADGAARGAWLDALPSVVGELAERWSLSVGAPFQPGGETAWVAPVRGPSDAEMVLKVARRHPEALHEADGLREWDGDGAVRLYACAQVGDATALLLERCVPGDPLACRPETEQDSVIAGLLRRLWREPAPGHPFRPLQLMCDAWADEFEQKYQAGRVNVDAGLAREGITLFRELPATAERTVLLCTDLHARNALASEREPWLVIDPKPYVGDPAYDVLQHMLNCRDRLHTDPRALAARMSDLAGLENERVILWLFARCVQESPDWPELADVARRIAPA
jgi:streptomycin 6-kinase